MSDNPTTKPSINLLDLEQERKRLRSVLRTAEGQVAFREALLTTQVGREIVRMEFGIGIVDKEQQADKPIVAILIPTHKKPENETGNALEKMIPVAREVCHVTMRPLVASSAVHWVRNQLLATLYKENLPFDYVLFMDDDMVPPPDALNVLLGRKVDIVGAACTVRQDPPLPNVRHFDAATGIFQTADIDRPGIWKVGGVGTGFMLISKKVLDAIAEYTLSQQFARKYLGMSEIVAAEQEKKAREHFAKEKNAWWFEFLRNPNGGEYGEDIAFCFKARECGFDIYADSSITVGHIGNYPFSIEDYWAYRDDAISRGLVKSLEAKDSGDKISILCPTRGRPESVKRLLESINSTSAERPEVLFYVDEDDDSFPHIADDHVRLIRGPRITLSDCWNRLASVATGDILLQAGDDIIFKTRDWDKQVKQAFAECGDKILFVHGDDAYWGEKFGTHGVVHRRWLDAVGYICPPYFSSDYGDTWLNDVANALGRRKYLPFVTEHMHPLFGKAEWDQTHKERLDRGERDNVSKLYEDLAPKREEDISRLRDVIEDSGATISVLIPSRGRTEELRKSIEALLSSACNPSRVEILVRRDDDDSSPYPINTGARLFHGERFGYEALHRYYNGLADKSTGEWLLVWNDDAIMQTQNWDAKIRRQEKGKILNLTGHFNTFPAVHRSIYEQLGHLSLQTHTDTWLQAISRECGLEVFLPMKIEHSSRDDKREGYSGTRDEFFSESTQKLLKEDIEKLSGVLVG